MKKNRSEVILSAVVWLVLVLACLGVVSSYFWYATAQEAASLKMTSIEQALIINALNVELADKRYKIEQANRFLAVAYPKSDRLFISEE